MMVMTVMTVVMVVGVGGDGVDGDGDGDGGSGGGGDKKMMMMVIMVTIAAIYLVLSLHKTGDYLSEKLFWCEYCPTLVIQLIAGLIARILTQAHEIPVPGLDQGQGTLGVRGRSVPLEAARPLAEGEKSILAEPIHTSDIPLCPPPEG